LRPEDYKGGAAVHMALKSVCPHARLKYDFPLGFHREFSSAHFYPNPFMKYHHTTLPLSNNRL
jgi:hypothetical protein